MSCSCVMNKDDVGTAVTECETAVELSLASLTAALDTVREAARHHGDVVVALRAQLHLGQLRCGALAAELAQSEERVRVLEEDLSSYRRVSRLIALENENARLRKKIADAVPADV